MMKQRLFVCGLVTVLVLCALAIQAAAQTKPKPAPVRKAAAEVAESGSIDLDRSRVYIFVGKKGRLGHEHAVVGRLKSGQITLGAPKEAGELVFDMTSFQADGAQARKYVGLEGETDAGTQQQVTDNMQSATVLDTKQFPTAKFVVASAQRVKGDQADGKPRYKLDGTFTLHGTARPLSVTDLVEEFEGETRLRGDFTILQTDYGIRPFSKAFGAVGVSNELKIWGDVLLRP
jgi:polyisoprenoid-binding protein YceI